MQNGIFPLIGQLEYAGACSKIFKQLEVKEEDLMRLKDYLKTILENYLIPLKEFIV